MVRTALLLVPIAALALYAYLVGLDRGTAGGAFHAFHPDEETLLRAALALTDPLDPPLTAYGALPLYLLKLALVGHVPPDIDAPDSAAQIYRKARLLAALIASAAWIVLWYLARRLYPPETAALTLLLTALSPLAIQQAHFYTVDGLFTLCSLAALYFVLRALDTGTWHDYALAGLLIGCTGAVRLNGLLLGPVLVAGHLVHSRQRLTAPALTAFVATITLVALQPYLAADPGRLLRDQSHADFGFSLDVARGALQTWSLIDLHTTPYLHYLTTLLPQGAGWPLGLAAIAGSACAAWRGSRPQRLLLLWAALYLLIVGGLHTKPIRYLYPLLPLLALCAASVCQYAWQRHRFGYALAALLAMSTISYGLAFTRIYAVEDSRLQAARWLDARGAHNIGLEKGAFTLHKLIDGSRSGDLNILNLFYTGPYMLCSQRAAYLHQRAQRLDYLALIDVNRYRQFTAAPARYPVAASFYRQLYAGKLGYDQVARFKTYPSLFGFPWRDDHYEPSFLGYDHPAVLIFARRADFDPAFARWQRDIAAESHCPDRSLAAIATALNHNDLPRARAQVETLLTAPAPSPLAQLLAAETFRRLEQPDLARQARRAYALPLATHLRNAPTLHRTPGATAAACAALDLPDLALKQLRDGIDESVFYPVGAMPDMADTYIAVAQILLARGHLDPMRQALELSIQIFAKPAAYNALARSAYFARDYSRAHTLWQRSLALDPAQADIRQALDQLTTPETPP
jgi:Tfp pilus assembly protein PilF